jgi:hypothetical protein
VKHKATSFFLTGIGVGITVAAYFVISKFEQRRRIANLHVTTQDLGYKDLSREELVSHHLTDLNVAGIEELKELGLDADSAALLIENRPYRSKLELVSRMVLPQELYAAIKNRIAIADAREPFKIG